MAALQKYEDRYRVSNHGKLPSLSYRGKPRQRLRKASHAGENTVDTYKLPGLEDYKHAVTVSAGQLVAANFLPPPPNERPHHVHYLDGNRRGLRWDNLAWYDTTNEALKVYMKRGRAYGQATALLTVEQAEEARQLIEQKQKGTTYKTIAGRYGVSE